MESAEMGTHTKRKLGLAVVSSSSPGEVVPAEDPLMVEVFSGNIKTLVLDLNPLSSL